MDSGPGPVAIDLAGTLRGDGLSHRCLATWIKTDSDGTVTIDTRDAKPGRPKDDTNPGWFSYKRVGTLRSGVHALETSVSSGWGIDTKAVVDRGDTVEIGAGERHRRNRSSSACPSTFRFDTAQPFRAAGTSQG